MKLTRRQELAVADYLDEAAAVLRQCFLNPSTKRVEPARERRQVQRLRRWAKRIRGTDAG